MTCPCAPLRPLPVGKDAQRGRQALCLTLVTQNWIYPPLCLPLFLLVSLVTDSSPVSSRPWVTDCCHCHRSTHTLSLYLLTAPHRPPRVHRLGRGCEDAWVGSGVIKTRTVYPITGSRALITHSEGEGVSREGPGESGEGPGDVSALLSFPFAHIGLERWKVGLGKRGGAECLWGEKAEGET